MTWAARASIVAVTASGVAFGSCSGAVSAAPSPSPTGITAGEASTYLLRVAGPNTQADAILIDDVILARTRGYVAVHANGRGAPGPELGVSELLPVGETRRLVVKLHHHLTGRGTVFVVIHLEDDGNQTYDFPRSDQPARVGGRIVVAEVPYEVP